MIQLGDVLTDNVMGSYIYTYPMKKSYLPYTDWKNACKHWEDVKEPINLYIHIPFCEMKCFFCDLFTATQQPKDVIERYVSCLLQEIEIMKDYLQLDQISIQSVYFGGGTPTLLNERQLSLIINKLKETFSFKANIEWSIEGAPNSLSEAKLTELIKCGINRLSIGIQTFDPTELKSVGRFYDPSLGYEMGILAVQSGIKNINLDLIYGIPGQSFDKWRENLLKAIEINPATITAYPLAVRDKTTFGIQKTKERRDDFVDTPTRYQWFDFTQEQLTQNGYSHHTLVTFAKQHGGCSHEHNEFKGSPTLSFGAGSRKYAPTLHYVDEDYLNRKPHKTTMLEYMDAMERGEILVKSAVHLNKKDQSLRTFILGLLSTGVNSTQLDIHFTELLNELEAEKCVNQKDQWITLTPKGKRYSSNIGHYIISRFNRENK